MTLTRRALITGVGAAVVASHPVAVLANCPTCRLFEGTSSTSSSRPVAPRVRSETQQQPAAAPSQRQQRAGRTRHLKMYNVNVPREVIDIVYWRDGSYDQAAMKRLNQFMRDWRRNTVRAIAPPVIDWLYQIQEELELNEPMGLVAGYRTVATNNQLRGNSSGVASRSLHLDARAIDFWAKERSTRQIAAAARRVGQVGGIGTYRDFVHIDNGRVRTW